MDVVTKIVRFSVICHVLVQYMVTFGKFGNRDSVWLMDKQMWMMWYKLKCYIIINFRWNIFVILLHVDVFMSNFSYDVDIKYNLYLWCACLGE